MPLTTEEKTTIKRIGDEYTDALAKLKAAEEELRAVIRPVVNIATHDCDVDTLQEVMYLLPSCPNLTDDVNNRIHEARRFLKPA